ncbi:MAG: RNA 2',3'-cyclic phosphodiesterase [Vicinamibacterales bacterium]
MRLFVAVTVGDEVRSAVTAARQTIEHQLSGLGGQPPRLVWVAPSALHVTLQFLGEVPNDRAPAIVEAVQEPFALAPFQVAWVGLGAFPSPRRPRAIWVGVSRGAAELGLLEAELARRLGTLLPGERPDAAAPFHPHLTIARVKTERPGVDWPSVLDAAKFEEVRSRVDHVALLRSRGLPGGAGYEEIGRGHLEG